MLFDEFGESVRQLGPAKRDVRLGLQDLRDAAKGTCILFSDGEDEEWRFTDLSSLLQIPFHIPQSNQSTVKLADIIMPVKNRDDLPLRLVFVNGF